MLAQGQQREAELEGQVAQTQSALRDARARLRRALDELADRLVTIYKSGAADPTVLLLEADGFDDLATRAELLGRIQEADSSLVDRVRDPAGGGRDRAGAGRGGRGAGCRLQRTGCGGSLADRRGEGDRRVRGRGAGRGA